MLRLLSRTLKQQVKLFTPGTVNTTETVKRAMMYDHSEMSKDFKDMVQDVNKRLLRLVNANELDYAPIFLPGPETYALEAALGTSFPQLAPSNPPKSMLIIANGVSGERMVRLCGYLGIRHLVLRFHEFEPYTSADVLEMLRHHPTISHVAAVHTEITTGLVNPIAEVGQLLHDYNPDITFIVDAMNSFGAIDLDLYESRVSFLVAGPNKSLQGVPGLAFVFANVGKLRRCRYNARSVALDLWSLWDFQLSHPGEFKSVPPTHVFAAMHQALLEHEAEGGVAARCQRYTECRNYLQQQLESLGFDLFIDAPYRGPGVTTVLAPRNPNYNFKSTCYTALYQCLSRYGMLIYPGKLSKVQSFRIATIGDVKLQDVEALIDKIKEAFKEMNIRLPLK